MHQQLCCTYRASRRDSAAQLMLLDFYLHEALIDEKNIAVVTMLVFQPTSMNCTEPGKQTKNHLAHNILIADFESEIQPDYVNADVGSESLALVCIHPTIMPATVCFPTAKVSKNAGLATLRF
ncbi:MAG: hypothetical protein ACJAWK_000762 [Candidatus Azotimanducaceae bacterium]|jgi:hypothetical protein